MPVRREDRSTLLSRKKKKKAATPSMLSVDTVLNMHTVTEKVQYKYKQEFGSAQGLQK